MWQLAITNAFDVKVLSAVLSLTKTHKQKAPPY